MAKIVYHWKDPGPLARWTLWAVAASAVVWVLFAGLDWIYRPDLPRPPDPPISPRYDALSGILSLLSFLTLIPGCMWLYRVSANARSWDGGMKHSPAGAFVWFLVPIAHFFMPFRVISEIYRVSGARSQLSLIVFWIFNVISLTATYAYLVLMLRQPDLTAPLWAEVINTALAVAAHPFFAWVVIDLTGTQQDSTRIAETFSEAAQPA